MLKAGRNYKLRVQLSRSAISSVYLAQDQYLEVEPPFTMEFDVNAVKMSGGSSVGKIRIYNLSKTSRNSIRKDLKGIGTNRKIILDAGYGDNLANIVNGDVIQCWSVREGNNFITTIEYMDGQFSKSTGDASIPIPAGTAQRDVIINLIKTLPNIQGYVVGDIAGTTKRGNAYSGNAWDKLVELTNGGIYIDKGKVYVLSDNEVIEGTTTKIDNSNGLLGTPTRFQNELHLSMLFEPNLRMFQLVTFESITDETMNGEYQVIGLHHRGVISAAVCGEATTDVTLRQLKAYNPVG